MARKIVSLAFMLLVALPATALAGGTTRVTSDCLHMRIRPDSIVLACADANWYASSLHWRNWQTGTAAGHGIFHFNDCVPDCASGTFHTRWGKIVLSQPRWCRGQGVHVFQHAAITYNTPWHHHTRFSASPPCPLR